MTAVKNSGETKKDLFENGGYSEEGCSFDHWQKRRMAEQENIGSDARHRFFWVL